MIDAKKYITTIIILLGIIMVGVSIINVFLLNLTHLFEVSVNIIMVLIVAAIIFSTIITYKVIKDTDINSKLMNINFKIVNSIFPLMIKTASFVGISKDEIRKVYVKLNNKYIYIVKSII